MLTVEMIKDLYAESDERAKAGDKAGAEARYEEAVALIERAAWMPVADAAAGLQRLDLAAYLAQAPELKAAIHAAMVLEPLERLIALRRVLAAEWGDDDRVPVGAVERAVEALARPKLPDA